MGGANGRKVLRVVAATDADRPNMMDLQPSFIFTAVAILVFECASSLVALVNRVFLLGG